MSSGKTIELSSDQSVEVDGVTLAALQNYVDAGLITSGEAVKPAPVADPLPAVNEEETKSTNNKAGK